MKRHLTLRSEHLAQLTPDDLASVAGGTTQLFTGWFLTLDRPCTPLTGAVDVTSACA
jgi:hypothetical protein